MFWSWATGGAAGTVRRRRSAPAVDPHAPMEFRYSVAGHLDGFTRPRRARGRRHVPRPGGAGEHLVRPRPPFHVGRTAPSSVGWTRTPSRWGPGRCWPGSWSARLRAARSRRSPFRAAGAGRDGAGHPLRGHERGLTVSLGGFLPRATWPLADHRIPAAELPASRGVARRLRRRGKAITPKPEGAHARRRAEDHPADMQRPYRMLVRAGTLVEIIGRERTATSSPPSTPPRPPQRSTRRSAHAAEARPWARLGPRHPLTGEHRAVLRVRGPAQTLEPDPARTGVGSRDFRGAPPARHAPSIIWEET